MGPAKILCTLKLKYFIFYIFISVTGAATTAGSFSFVLLCPINFLSRYSTYLGFYTSLILRKGGWGAAV
jgi:hypothetical protein